MVQAIGLMAGWHDRAKEGLDPRCFEIAPHRFPADEPRVVFDEDGVVVTAWPVPHSISGAVGYRLDYAGSSVVCTGDGEPSMLTVENAEGADLLIHEIFNPPETYMEIEAYKRKIANEGD